MTEQEKLMVQQAIEEVRMENRLQLEEMETASLKLQSQNQELQSINQELLSANQELDQRMQELSSENSELRKELQSKSERIEMMSRSDLELKKAAEEKKILEERIKQIENREEVLKKREEEIEAGEDLLDDKKFEMNRLEDKLISREKELQKKESKLASVINSEADRKIRGQIQQQEELYKQRAAEADAGFRKEKRNWHLLHDGSFILMLIFSVVYTAGSASLWNEGYADNVKTTVTGIADGLIYLFTGIWRLAELIGSLGKKISNDLAAKIVQKALIIVVVTGIIVSAYIAAYKLFRKLMEHWKEIHMWNVTSLIIASAIFGATALLPAEKINWFGIGILVYIAYIAFRSFYCVENTELRNDIVKIVAYIVIIIGLMAGLVYSFAIILKSM